jgi:hypothetical protein
MRSLIAHMASARYALALFTSLLLLACLLGGYTVAIAYTAVLNY